MAPSTQGIPPPWHTRSTAETASDLRTDITQGLGRVEAAERLARHGPNTLAEASHASPLTILVHQFQSLMVALLIAAGGVALVLGDRIEALAILVVILLNAVIGFVTEWKAAAALDGLRKRAVSLARVVRDGRDQQTDAANLVTGDVVLLAEGDRVHADGRLIEQARLTVDEAALTGESLPVAKHEDSVADRKAPLGDRTSMVHRSTAVTAGRGRFIVTATGTRTEIGRIGALIAGVAQHGTPLEAKLAQLSRVLLVIVLLCAVIVLVGWLRGNALLFMVEVGISLAVAAVPEGLLAVTTMTLAVGMQRMARMNALVRRLPAVESLGSTTVICTDKTGTLTRNEMTVRAFDVAARRFEVTGAGYAANGTFEVEGRAVDVGQDRDARGLSLALRIGALCNDGRVDRTGDVATVLGDPTEGALLVAAEKAGLTLAELTREYPRTAEIRFDSDTKLMVTVHDAPDGTRVAYVKGAPAAVLEASISVLGVGGTAIPSPTERQRIEAANDALAASAMRVLGLAYRELPPSFVEADLTRDLTFVGLVGLSDPLRVGVPATIATCHAAGIRTVMITGDQEATAAEIARQLGLDVAPDGTPLRIVHARDLTGLDDEGWRAIVADAAVFARVSPEHKLRIVEALQGRGNIVAMTGDGVNDAPALRKADIGIAMGIRGTEVAKDAADMIIVDDDFSTIVGAVEQGRVIVANILRFLHYLFSCNLAEIVTVFAAIMIGWPLPLGVMQILWLNLVTDIFPAMALALEPSDPDVMTRPPRDPAQALMTPRFGWLIVWQGLLLGGCTLVAFAIGMDWYGVGEEGLRHAVTIAFMTLAMTQVAHAFSARSRTRSMLTGRLFTNGWLWGATAICVALQLAAVYVPLLRQVLHTVPLTYADWGVVAAGALAPVVVIEVVKLAPGRRGPSVGTLHAA